MSELKIPKTTRKPKPTSLPRETHMKPGRNTSGGSPPSMRQVGGFRHKTLQAARPTAEKTPAPTFTTPAKRIHTPKAQPKGDEAVNATSLGTARRIRPTKSRPRG